MVDQLGAGRDEDIVEGCVLPIHNAARRRDDGRIYENGRPSDIVEATRQEVPVTIRSYFGEA